MSISIKTIEERAEKAFTINQYRCNHRLYKISFESGYIQGATEQKDIDIDKACEWLKENIEGGVHPSSAYGFVEKFRKAMEE